MITAEQVFLLLTPEEKIAFLSETTSFYVWLSNAYADPSVDNADVDLISGRCVNSEAVKNATGILDVLAWVFTVSAPDVQAAICRVCRDLAMISEGTYNTIKTNLP